MTGLPTGIELWIVNQLGSTVNIAAMDNLELEVSDETPGGYADANFKLCELETIPKLYTKVWIYDNINNATVWLGRVEDVDITYPNGPIQVRCRGYSESLQDQRFRASQIYTTSAELADVVTHAVSQLAPEFATGGIVFNATGILLAEDTSDFALQTALDVINSMIALTSIFTTPLTWHAREAALAGADYPTLYFSFADPVSRYRMLLTEDLITLRSSYQGRGIVNRSTVQWGNQQFATQPNPEVIDYTAIPIIRDKGVNAENDVRVFSIADNMAASLLARFENLRSVSDTIELCPGALVTAIPPAGDSSEFPIHLLKSGYAVDIQNMPAAMSPYLSNDKYIVKSTHNFTSGKTTLTCGEIPGLGASIRALLTILNSRPYQISQFSAQSYAMVDNDQLPTFGPQMDGISPPSFSGGVPIFTGPESGEEDSELAPYKKVIHPGVIADFGLEANHTIGNLNVGPKGGIRTIPGLYKSWDAYFDNSETTDSINIRIYKKAAVPTTSTLQHIGTIIISSNTHGSGLLNTPTTMANGDRIFFEIMSSGTIVPPATEPTIIASLISISIKGSKQYPGLKL